MEYILQIEGGDEMRITRYAIASTVYRYRDGAIYDLCESILDAPGDRFVKITDETGRVLTSDELDAIRDAAIAEGH